MKKEEMSNKRKAALETVESVSRKTMVWAPLVALFAFITKGAFIPVDTWKAMMPLAVIAGVIWYWAAGQLPGDQK